MKRTSVHELYEKSKSRATTEGLSLPKKRWKKNWASDTNNLATLYAAVRITRPEVILETGTLEGHGTVAMAQGANANDNSARIITIDYDGDPTTELPSEDWKHLANIRNENLDEAILAFPGCEIRFVEGDSTVVLNNIFPSQEQKWDFFYQDSMHYLEGILKEWTAIKAYASTGAIAIFDDVKPTKGASKLSILDRSFLGWFARRAFLSGWSYVYIPDGHGQLWAQKYK